MKHASRPISVVVTLLTAAYIVFGMFAVLTPRTASANVAPSGSFTQFIVGSNGDFFYTWDFLSTNPFSYTNVDWGSRFFFIQNAEIDKVKNILDGIGTPSISPTLGSSGGAMFAFLHDGPEQGASSNWDQDSGIKQGLWCSWDHHMRFYARTTTDRNYDVAVGYYIMGTNHRDYELGICTHTYTSYESDEDWWKSRIDANTSWITADSWYNFSNGNGNVASDIGGGNHSYASDGWPVTVWVP